MNEGKDWARDWLFKRSIEDIAALMNITDKTDDWRALNGVRMVLLGLQNELRQQIEPSYEIGCPMCQGALSSTEIDKTTVGEASVGGFSGWPSADGVVVDEGVGELKFKLSKPVYYDAPAEEANETTCSVGGKLVEDNGARVVCGEMDYSGTWRTVGGEVGQVDRGPNGWVITFGLHETDEIDEDGQCVNFPARTLAERIRDWPASQGKK